MSGTSMASPIVAGALCMMLSTSNQVSANRAEVLSRKQTILDVFTRRLPVIYKQGHTDAAIDMSFYNPPYAPGGSDAPSDDAPEQPKKKSSRLKWFAAAFVVAFVVACLYG
jgi:hypothetical protein